MAETREVLIPRPDPDKWVDLEKTGMRIQTLWENPETGALQIIPLRAARPTG